MSTKRTPRQAAQRIIDSYREVCRLSTPHAECDPSQSSDNAVILAWNYLIEHPSDSDEPADTEWLQGCGAKWSTDGTALVLKGDAGPQIICGVNQRSGEDYVGSLGLQWRYLDAPPKVCLSYLIEDDPTKGQVRRLCASLGVELKEVITGL